MGPSIIARNYAETLLELAHRHGDAGTVEAFGRALDVVVELLRREPRVREFLETPRVETAAKQRALRTSFQGRVPDVFLRFLLVVVEKRRQALLPQIAREYQALVDVSLNRVRADVALARPADPELQREIVRSAACWCASATACSTARCATASRACAGGCSPRACPPPPRRASSER